MAYKIGFLPYALAALLIGLVGGFSTVLGPAFVQDMGIAYNNTTWTALAQAMSTAACAPILGKIGDVIGRRKTLLPWWRKWCGMQAASMCWSITLAHPTPARIWILQTQIRRSFWTRLNLRSVFMASQAAAKYMAEQGGGSIINISSVGGLVPDISQIAYGTSKAAINYLTKLIATQEAKHHIRCNAVLPGMTATEAVEKHLSEAFRNLFVKHIPLGRMGLPEEIAEAMCYFAGDASAYTTGQILTISGGFGLATPVYGDLIWKAGKR